ncbi:XdhC family protein [Alicyclobacillus dauci]|uniref:XdhC family protein n=1 Tax=Alicyclobacillus dauci TaxID=1475485 RepID=A0ABY6Z4H3_9BACL|nr:XdhC/CoxI family protein [Alicyclobacillus dauci]WAH37756.1 XdhC family protein [Alicyclobacillus dauci]
MTTRSDLAAALQNAMDTGQRAAVAVVIETDGSVYRRAGARSVVTEEGLIYGVISGGCAEQDLLERAKEAWTTGLPQRMTYDFRSPDDLLWGMGAGCNGALTVCLIPFDPAAQGDLAERLLADMKERADTQDQTATVTILSSSDPDVWPVGPLLGDKRTALLERLPAKTDGLPLLRKETVDGVDVEVFIDEIVPRSRLVLFGAGDDAMPLVRFAAQSDWHVTVIDHRDAFLNAQRFPEADVRSVIRRDEYDHVSLEASSFVVVMTHSYEFDRRILTGLLPMDIPYLGILGPRRRFERLLGEIVDAGLQVSDADLQKVHSPVGLDIGAETPEEIALSVLTEAMARRRNRDGASLRERAGQISVTALSK